MDRNISENIDKPVVIIGPEEPGLSLDLVFPLRVHIDTVDIVEQLIGPGNAFVIDLPYGFEVPVISEYIEIIYQAYICLVARYAPFGSIIRSYVTKHPDPVVGI